MGKGKKKPNLYKRKFRHFNISLITEGYRLPENYKHKTMKRIQTTPHYNWSITQVESVIIYSDQ